MITQTFEFAGSNGRRLIGRVESPIGQVRGWAVFAHCFTCGKDNLTAVRIARSLAATGIGTLRFDFAGQGQSEGQFRETNFASNVDDIVAAVDAMAETGMTPCLLIGHSLGGAAVLAAAGRAPRVKAVVTVNAPFDVAHALHQFEPAGLAAIEEKGEAEVMLGGRPFVVGKQFIDDVRSHDQGNRIATLHRPLLVLHSPRDDVVGLDNATNIFVAARHPKSFISLDSADHLLSRSSDAGHAASLISTWASPYLEAAERLDDPPDVEAAETGGGKFQLLIKAGPTRLFADEPVEFGGLGSGPSPYQLICAALAACTTMTMRVYANQKGWSLRRAATAVGHSRDRDQSPADAFALRISLDGDLDESQRRRLLEIAGNCPVHRTIERGARFDLAEGAAPAPNEPAGSHLSDMEQIASRD